MICTICLSKKTKYFANKIGYIFYRCSNCRAVFLPTLPSIDTLKKYYARTFAYSDGQKNEALIRKRSEIILKKLKELSPGSKTVCDVGSGFGFFLDEAKNVGLTPLGIEPSIDLSKYSRRNFKIPTYTGSLQDFIHSSDTQFDLVSCIHVIEHVQNPKKFIDQLSQLVKGGGYLYIETPNSDSHLLYVERDTYTFLIPPDHLWLFSARSIEQLLPKNMKIVYKKTYSYSEHFMGIVKVLFRNMLRHNSGLKNYEKANIQNINTIVKEVKSEKHFEKIRKKIFYYLFDRTLAPCFTGTLNINHKGSILGLYINKLNGKSGL